MIRCSALSYCSSTQCQHLFLLVLNLKLQSLKSHNSLRFYICSAQHCAMHMEVFNKSTFSCRCCCKFKRLWKGGRCCFVLGSYICSVLHGWVDCLVPQHTLLKHPKLKVVAAPHLPFSLYLVLLFFLAYLC